MARLQPTLALDGLGRTDVVIEAVVEDSASSRDLPRTRDARAPECVLATNTSSLSIRAIAKNCARPERVVGMHFFNPVTKMPLVEVICHEGSDEAAVETVVALTRRMGKTPVVVGDAPGFLVNRILMPYLGEAVSMVEHGTPIESIDRALRAFGMPLGPCELLDEIGLDVARKVAHVLEEAFGERMPRTRSSTSWRPRARWGRSRGRASTSTRRGSARA